MSLRGDAAVTHEKSCIKQEIFKSKICQNRRKKCLWRAWNRHWPILLGPVWWQFSYLPRPSRTNASNFWIISLQSILIVWLSGWWQSSYVLPGSASWFLDILAPLGKSWECKSARHSFHNWMDRQKMAVMGRQQRRRRRGSSHRSVCKINDSSTCASGWGYVVTGNTATGALDVGGIGLNSSLILNLYYKDQI